MKMQRGMVRFFNQPLIIYFLFRHKTSSRLLFVRRGRPSFNKYTLIISYHFYFSIFIYIPSFSNSFRDLLHRTLVLSVRYSSTYPGRFILQRYKFCPSRERMNPLKTLRKASLVRCSPLGRG